MGGQSGSVYDRLAEAIRIRSDGGHSLTFRQICQPFIKSFTTKCLYCIELWVIKSICTPSKLSGNLQRVLSRALLGWMNCGIGQPSALVDLWTLLRGSPSIWMQPKLALTKYGKCGPDVTVLVGPHTNTNRKLMILKLTKSMCPNISGHTVSVVTVQKCTQEFFSSSLSAAQWLELFWHWWVSVMSRHASVALRRAQQQPTRWINFSTVDDSVSEFNCCVWLEWHTGHSCIQLMMTADDLKRENSPGAQ